MEGGGERGREEEERESREGERWSQAVGGIGARRRREGGRGKTGSKQCAAVRILEPLTKLVHTPQIANQGLPVPQHHKQPLYANETPAELELPKECIGQLRCS